MRARARSRAFSKPYPRKVWRVTGIVRGAKRLKGESGSVAQAQRSEKKTRSSTSQLCAVGRTSSPAPGRKPRPRPRAWADSIKRDFGHDPLLDYTGKKMRW